MAKFEKREKIKKFKSEPSGLTTLQFGQQLLGIKSAISAGKKRSTVKAVKRSSTQQIVANEVLLAKKRTFKPSASDK